MPLIGDKHQVQTDRIVILYNDQLHMGFEWLGSNATSIVERNDSAQMGIQVNGKLITDFQFQPDRSFQTQIQHAEFGQAVSVRVSGMYQKGQVKIRRLTHILLPDKFPDVVLLTTEYTNLGNTAVHIDKVYSQHLLVNRQLAEPRKKPYNFASFQGGAYKWGSDYALIMLKPGFYQRNFMGIHDVDRGNYIYQIAGGMPFIDVWGKTMGVAVAHLQPKPAWVALPIKVRDDGRVEMAVTEEPKADLAQQEWLYPKEAFETVLTAVIFHKLDYHDPLRIYGTLLRCRGVAIKDTSQPSDHDPYWMSWGFRRDFTQDKILHTLPSLRSMGITRANLDAGWFDFHGDWNPQRSPGKFPHGERDIVTFVEQVNNEGFRMAVWWFPFAVNPESTLARERPDLLVQAQDGSFTRGEEQNYQLCPAYEPALEHIEKLVQRFTNKWGFDGFYIDKISMLAVPPCYNKIHKHKSPMESFEAVPEMYKRIEQTLHQYVEEPFNEVCICSMPHSPYNMPYYSIASASDPITPQQARRRIKVEKAIHGPTFAVGDSYQQPADEWGGTGVQESFESAIGTGAKMTAQYADLDSTELQNWQTWFRKYFELGLSSGEYLNYYDMAFDKPEVHVVRKGQDLYYGMFADHWSRRHKIELRGLDKDETYEVYDYAHERNLGSVNGVNPYLNIGFKESLLIRVRAVGRKAS